MTSRSPVSDPKQVRLEPIKVDTVKRESSKVVIQSASPDSTVRTSDIPADLKFPDFVDFTFNDVGDFAHIIGTAISGSEQNTDSSVMAKVESNGVVSLESPSMMDYIIAQDNNDLVALQPLQELPGVHTIFQNSDEEAPWHNHVTSMSNSRSEMWGENNHSPLLHAKSEQVTVTSVWNGNGLTNGKSSSGSHLKDLLTGENNVYAKRSDTLLQLLKNNYEHKSEYNGYSNGIKAGNGLTFTPITSSYQNSIKGEVGSTVDSHCYTNGHKPYTNGDINGQNINIDVNVNVSIDGNGRITKVPQSNGVGSSSNDCSPKSDHSGIMSSPISRTSVSSRHKIRSRAPANMKKDGRLHPCTICTKSFKDRFSLEAHFRIHTGERPFKCTVCGKGFKQKAHMQKHATMHLGVQRNGLPSQNIRVKREPFNRDRNRNRNKFNGIKKEIQIKPMQKDANFNHITYNDAFDPNVSTTTDSPNDNTTKSQFGELYRRLTSAPASCKQLIDNDIYGESLVFSEINGNGETKQYQALPGFNEIQPFSKLDTFDNYPNIDSSIEEVKVRELHSTSDSSTFYVENPNAMVEMERKVLVKFTRTGSDQHQCSVCRQHVQHKQDMADHARTHAGTHTTVKLEDVFGAADDNDAFPCLSCGKDFQKDDFMLHACGKV